MICFNIFNDRVQIYINVKNSHLHGCHASISVTVQRRYFFLLEKKVRCKHCHFVRSLSSSPSKLAHKLISAHPSRNFRSLDNSIRLAVIMLRLYAKVFRVSLGHCTPVLCVLQEDMNTDRSLNIRVLAVAFSGRCS